MDKHALLLFLICMALVACEPRAPQKPKTAPAAITAPFGLVAR